MGTLSRNWVSGRSSWVHVAVVKANLHRDLPLLSILNQFFSAMISQVQRFCLHLWIVMNDVTILSTTQYTDAPLIIMGVVCSVLFSNAMTG